jgi:hypothetical protein
LRPKLCEESRAEGADSALSEIEDARAIQRVHEMRLGAFNTCAILVKSLTLLRLGSRRSASTLVNRRAAWSRCAAELRSFASWSAGCAIDALDGTALT